MLEVSQHKTRLKLAIETCQQVQIERCRHAQGIVISQQQVASRLLHVGSQQECVVGLENPPDLPQERYFRGVFEIPDRTAQKKYQHLFSGAALGRNVQQPVEVLSFATDDADALDVAEFALAHCQCSRRNLDWKV